MKTLVIYPSSETYEDAEFYLLDPDTGEVLNSHLCSCSYYAKDDLYFRHEDIINELSNKYNDEILIKFIDETNYDIEHIIELNREFYEERNSKIH